MKGTLRPAGASKKSTGKSSMAKINCISCPTLCLPLLGVATSEHWMLLRNPFRVCRGHQLHSDSGPGEEVNMADSNP